MPPSLVRNLFPGPIDVIADVHGEIDALLYLLSRLGYREDGTHPEGRRLVFLGDLSDRGPDSPAVVEFVQGLVDNGMAQCVLGNHDLNILLGDEKPPDNNWFFGQERYFEGVHVPQVLVHDEATRKKIRDFLTTLPLALERPGLRVVHACWQTEMVEVARQETNTVELYRRHAQMIDENVTGLDEIARGLAAQNKNPVKLLTSGPERRAAVPFEDNGKIRHEERVPWWDDYADPEYCIFGHYGAPQGQPHGHGRAICIDYAVAKRWRERLYPEFRGTFKGKLAAIRFPEKVIVFDDGAMEPVG